MGAVKKIIEDSLGPTSAAEDYFNIKGDHDRLARKEVEHKCYQIAKRI